MKAMILKPLLQQLDLLDRPIPEPGAGEAVIRMRAAALNHRDLYLYRGWPSSAQWNEFFSNRPPFVLGADGAGTIHALGADVAGWQVGDEVMINPSQTCGTCEHCLRGEHYYCDQFNCLGGPSDGTFAEYVKIPARHLVKKPSYLSFEEAASLPLALGTAWHSIINRGQLKPGETILLQGIGGGVALFALQIASAMGVKAIVTSSSDKKLEQALAFGAFAGINYKNETDITARVLELTDGRGVDLTLETTGKLTYPTSIRSLAKGGRIVHAGATTAGSWTEGFDFSSFAARRNSFLIGGMPSQQDLTDALAFFEQHQIKPQIKQGYALIDTDQALRDLEHAIQFGKIVISIA